MTRRFRWARNRGVTRRFRWARNRGVTRRFRWARNRGVTRRFRWARNRGVTRRLLAWLGVVVIGGSAFLFGAVDEGPPRTDADRVYDLAKSFGCPVCDGQSVAESDSVVARNIRQQIARDVDDGRSDETIIAELEAAFPGNDYTPAASGLSSLVWILPVVAGAGALAGLVVVFRRWRREIELGASPADERLVAEFRSEADSGEGEDQAEPTPTSDRDDA